MLITSESWLAYPWNSSRLNGIKKFPLEFNQKLILFKMSSQYAFKNILNYILSIKYYSAFIGLLLTCLQNITESLWWMWETSVWVSKKIGKFDFIEMSYQPVKKIKHRNREKDSYCQSRDRIIEKDEEAILCQKLKIYGKAPEVTCGSMGIISC